MIRASLAALMCSVINGTSISIVGGHRFALSSITHAEHVVHVDYPPGVADRDERDRLRFRYMKSELEQHVRVVVRQVGGSPPDRHRDR